MADNEENVTKLPDNQRGRTVADKLIDENKKAKQSELEKATKEAAAALQIFSTAIEKVEALKEDIAELEGTQRALLKGFGL